MNEFGTSQEMLESNGTVVTEEDQSVKAITDGGGEVTTIDDDIDEKKEVEEIDDEDVKKTQEGVNGSVKKPAEEKKND